MTVQAGLRNQGTAHTRRAFAWLLLPPPSKRSKQNILGLFFCFSHLCSLLELIYPSGLQSSIQEGHVLPL